MFDNWTIVLQSVLGFVIVVVSFRKEILGLFKKKSVELGSFSDYDKMMYQAEKALNDCKNLIEENIPDSFNFFQKWIVTLMLYKAFNGACKDHVRTLVMRNGFGTMPEDKFTAYCQLEPMGVMRAVSGDMTIEWNGKEKWFPISREKYEEHNYKACGQECGERIVKFFIACREIKKGII